MRSSGGRDASTAVPVGSGGGRDAPVAIPAGPGGGQSVPAFVPAGIVLAWAALLLAQLVGAPMSHDELAGGSLSLPAAAGIFGAGWVLMVAAMMLPSSYPMVRAFSATIAGRAGRRNRPGHPALPDRPGGGEVARFLVGYVAVWTVFGLALFAGDLGLHALVDGSAQPFATHTTLLGNALLIAGAFQLTDRKRRCLGRCRHPAEFLRRHGRLAAAAAPVGAFRLGREYGVHCLGSCWALMLAVFALGKPEVLWMAAFGAVMLYEKVGRQGLVAARLAGAVLLAGSLAATFS
jgi:predicted metal-binding membrane protein